MRSSVAMLCKRALSSFFALTLTLGLVPVAAFAAEGEELNDLDVAGVVLVDDEPGAEESSVADAVSSGASTFTSDIINQEVSLSTVAQAESTKSFFLAQTLESTKTVPVVSAKLPLDMGTSGSSSDAAQDDAAAGAEGSSSDASSSSEGAEGGEDPAEPDLSGASVSVDSTVVGSFIYRGITYAVEPGGESVTVVAADYAKLPEEFIEVQTIVLPSVVTSDDIDLYAVSRIADGAFSSLTENVAAMAQVGRDADASASSEEEPSIGITAITIPASVAEIGDGAFSGFDTLQYVIVSEDNPAYGMYDGCLYDAELTSLLLIPEGRLGAVRVAPSATAIDPLAFSHCAVDTVIADPDSAAYQLLQGNDLLSDHSIELKASDGTTDEMISRCVFDYVSGSDDLEGGISSHDPSDLDGPFQVELCEKGLDGNGTLRFRVRSTMFDAGRLYADARSEAFDDRSVQRASSVYMYYGSKVGGTLTYTTAPSSKWYGTNATYGNYYQEGWAGGYRLTNGGKTWQEYENGSATRYSYSAKHASIPLLGWTAQWFGADQPALIANGAILSSYTNVFAVFGYTTTLNCGYTGGANSSFIALHRDPTAGAVAAPQSLAAPSRAGYAFIGYYEKAYEGKDASFSEQNDVFEDAGGRFNKKYWYKGISTEANGALSVGRHDGGANIPATFVKNHTLYADWERDVLLDTQGALTPDTAQRIRVAQNGSLPDKDIEGQPLAVPVRPGYRFGGYWSTDCHESKTSSLFYEVSDDGSRLVPVEGRTWDIDQDRLYAHWKYKIVLDSNVVDSDDRLALDVSTITLDMRGYAGSVEEGYKDRYGNEYAVVRSAGSDGDDETLSILAIDGAPIKLPIVSGRTGYGNTQAWGVTKRECGSASDVIALVDGYTARDGAAFDIKGNGAFAALFADDSNIEDGVFSLALYADWTGMARAHTVTLSAGSHAVEEGGTSWTDEVLEGIVYDKTLQEAGVTSVSVPSRDGHTFVGFYTEEEGGQPYIDAMGAPVAGKAWTLTAPPGENGARHVTLYAHWTQDAYEVIYDLSLPAEGGDGLESETPGKEPIAGSAPSAIQGWTCGQPCSYDGGTFPIAQSSPVTAPGLFFRNGYDFAGWYWVDDTEEKPVAVKVCGADGSPRGAFAPSLAWQRAHKGSLGSDGSSVPGTIVLYAAWTPKVYALAFDMGYNEQENRVLPDGSMAGATLPNKVASRGGVYYYEVAYEQDLTPFFEGEGGAAAAAIPQDEPYVFIGWKVASGLGAGSMLFDDDEDVMTSPVLEGAYAPAYPLSTRSVGEGGVPATIVYRGTWKAPEPVEMRLSAGDGSRGAFATASFGDMDPDIFDAEASDASTLVFHDVDYDRAFDLLSARSPYRPQARPGYALAGFVLTNANGELLASDGHTLLGYGPYDDAGELRSGLPLLSSLSKLKADTYALAVYSKNKMVVELDMSDVPQREGYEGYALYTKRDDGTYGSGWVIGGAPCDSTVYAFDVSSASFSLPDDVIVFGYVFEGWERVSPDASTPVPDVFDPAALAVDPSLAYQVFKPVFSEKTYEVSFLDNHRSGAGGLRSATVSFDGTIVDAGDFEGATGYEVGQTLPMASVPGPETAETDPSHTGSDAEGPHYHSYPFTCWRVGSAYSSLANPERMAGQCIAPSEWSEWLFRFAAPEPGTKKAAEALSIYAIWQRAVSAVLPLSANVALDPETGSVSMSDESYDVYGVGLLEDEALEVAAIRYESVLEDAAGNLTAGDNVLQVRGVPIRLTLFANTGKPVIAEPFVEDGIVRGDYGTVAGNALSIPLDQRSAVFDETELASHGFAPFTSISNRLALRYGLDLDGCSIADVRALKDKLPKPGAGQEQASAVVPFARLCYTVRIVS